MEHQDCLLIGLGNPGEQYRHTRHNVGFMVLEHFLGRFARGNCSEKWQAQYIALTLSARRVHVVMPMTYMNLSGRAVAQFARFFKTPAERILVVHDDLDMHPGRIKLVKGGGSGGHNGIKSLVECLGAAEFYRLKIGIGRPGKGEVHPEFPVERYVLSEFSAVEKDIVNARFPAVSDGIRLFFEQGAERAMGALNILK